MQMFLCFLKGIIDYLVLKSKEGTSEVCEVVSLGSRGVLLFRIDRTNDRIDITIIILDQLDCCFESNTIQGLEVVTAI
jgi:hypothetical protein